MNCRRSSCRREKSESSHRDVVALADSEASHIADERAVWIAVHREAAQIDVVRKPPGSDDLRK